MQFYADTSREGDKWSLPDAEVFELTARECAEMDEDMVHEYMRRNEFRLAGMNSRDREKMFDAMIEEECISGAGSTNSAHRAVCLKARLSTPIRRSRKQSTPHANNVKASFTLECACSLRHIRERDLNRKGKPMLKITNAEASENLLAHVTSGRLKQGVFHTKDAGHEVACILGSFHPKVNKASDCNGDLMPLWMAKLTMTLFDKLPRDAIYPIGERYGALVARWHVLTPAKWDTILTAFLVRCIDDALDAARPVAKDYPYWAAVETASAQCRAAILSKDMGAARAADAADAAARAAADAAGAAGAAAAAAYAADAADAAGAAGAAARAAAYAADAAGAALKLFTFVLDQIELQLAA